MKNHFRSVVRLSLAVVLLGALSCSNNENTNDGTGVSENGNEGSNNSSSSSGNSVTIDMPRQPDSTGTPAIQVDPTDGSGPIHTGSSGSSATGTIAQHSTHNK